VHASRAACLLVAGALLPAAAAPLDWKTYVNVRYGYQLCYPDGLLNAQPEADNADGRSFVGPDGAQLLVFGTNNVLQSSLADEASQQASGYAGTRGRIGYHARGRGWIVISGDDGAGSLFYTKTFERGDQFLAFQLKYPKAAAAKYKPVVERLNRCFVALKPGF
jgi:hypothetical protein